MRGLMIALLVICGAAIGGVPAQASPYATYHADMVWVTPYMTHAPGDLGAFTSAPSGQEWLIVWLSAVNRNDIPRSVGGSEFHLISSDGQVQDANFESISPVFGGTLIPGASTKGTITFAVPKGSHSALLKWVTNAYDSSWPTFTWKVRY